MGNYVNEKLLDPSPMKKQKAEAKILVNKWEKTGLLDGLNEEFQKNGMAVLLENQARELISENSQTNPSGLAGDEEWSGVALPLVRRIFGSIAAQNFVSVQPMNLPSGLVFYLDFKYGTSRHGQNQTIGATAPGGAEKSVFGKTGKNTPEDAAAPYGEGGLYGEGRFGYTQQSASVGIPLSGSTNVTAGTAFTTSSIDVAEDLFHDSITSASFAADGGFGSAGDGYYVIEVGQAAFTNPDLLSIRAWGISSSGAGGAEKIYPQFTKINATTGNVEFVISGSGAGHVAASSQSISYFTQPVAEDRGDFEDSQGDATKDFLNIPEVDLQLNSLPIVAKTRKLKAIWTPELAQDLNAYHSVDAEAELTSMLSEYISLEIDMEILDMLYADAPTVDYWSAKAGMDYNSSTDLFEDNVASWFGTRFEWWQTLVQKINKMSNEIHRLTLRGGANFIVCSPKVSTILESLPGYMSSPGADATVQNYSAGISKVGNVDSRFSIYKNPYQDDNQILVGFRGGNFLETGAVYAPYVPLIMTPLVYDPSDFTPRKGVMTRYAKKMIRPEFYGKIAIKDLNLL
jgi:hypothetical protein